MDHINLFQTNAEFLSAYNGSDYIEPWVSLTEENMALNYNKKQLPPPHDYSVDPLTFKILSSGNISWVAKKTAYTATIEYSKDNGNTWVSITSTTAGTSFNVNAGDTIQFKGDNATYSNTVSNNNMFSGSTAMFEAEGNIMSLIDSTGYTTATRLASSYTFYYLFRYCTGLTSAENLVLPATTLTQYCYANMFGGCTNLTKAPELPATSLVRDCYSQMFYGCTSLTTAPELPATTLATRCYNGMFRDCANLITAPELPATTLAEECYNAMFYGCTGLTSAPELPATTLTKNCYYGMFWGCTSLTRAPELPATTLTSWCYSYMFLGCTNLNYIKCLATNISASNCTAEWVDSVASAGTFVKPSTTDWSSKTGTNGIPTNWTVEDAS